MVDKEKIIDNKNRTNESGTKAKDQSDEIEAFLSQFDDPPSPQYGPPGGPGREEHSGSDADDIDIFLRQFDNIPDTASDDKTEGSSYNDRRRI